MKKIFFSLILTGFCLSSTVFSQEEEILMTIGDQKVTKDEFERIYHKNNSSAVYDNKSVDEYLDLFINFKLKVIEAEALGYDTSEAFINELAGYRDQLAKPYLEDKEVTEKLLEEAYYRTAHQVCASHILVRVDPSASAADTAAAYKKITDIRNRILAGEPFEKVAEEASEDQSAMQNKGYLGWFGAFKMVFPFEDMAFKTPVGEVSMPFRTQFGYHILRNEGIRESKGRVKIAHIVILASVKDSAARKEKEARLNECYNRIKAGENFAMIADTYSEDRRTVGRGGELGWYGSESFSPEIEKVVFALKDTGDVSEPVATDYGWHIFKLLGKVPVESFDKLKPDLEKKVFNDERSRKLNDAMVDKIKHDNNFKQFRENLKPVIALIDETIYDGKWDPSVAENLIDPVISFGDSYYLQNEFARFITDIKRFNRKSTIPEIVDNRFNEFVQTKAIDYEKSLLEEKYPDFKNLMKEYHDGILLFNLTDEMVWSKAVKDTTGLENFYQQNKQNYMWKDRANISVYSFNDKALNKKVMAVAKKRAKNMMPPEEVNIAVCGSDTVKCLTVKDEKIEKEDFDQYKGLAWKKGAVLISEKDGKTELVFVNNLLQPEVKKLDEARGIITADYQTYLEKEWIKTLRAKYAVTVNEEVLKKVK